MKLTHVCWRIKRSSISPSASMRWRIATITVALPLLLLHTPSLARPQQREERPAAAASVRARKLPSPEKIVGDYLKAIGGKKRVAAIRDATYEWTAQGNAAQDNARARIQTKAPAAERTELTAGGGGELIVAANARSAWTLAPGGILQTLTGAESQIAKLSAALAASRLVDYKRSNVLARTVALDQTGSEPAYIIEFSTREGARIRYWFGASSKLLWQISDDVRRMTFRFGDYRLENNLLEPHQLTQQTGVGESRTLMLQSVRYNTGIGDTVFDPPRSAEAIDVPVLLREVARNQEELDGRISDYTFTRKQIEREISDRGEVKKEKIVVHEIYPVRGGGRVLKLVSEDGVPLSPERASKEEKRVVEELAKAEREYEKRKLRRAREREERARKKAKGTGVGENGDDDDLGVGAFLRACEFVSPRREQFRGRDTIVFDFRAPQNFRPKTREESIISKLTGVVWIDPADKQVMRLEARLVQGFKIGGGLLASVRPGSAFAFEQTRLPDGVWLPRFAQISASAKLFLLAGFKLDATREYSDYKRFSTKVGDAVLDAPQNNDK